MSETFDHEYESLCALQAELDSVRSAAFDTALELQVAEQKLGCAYPYSEVDIAERARRVLPLPADDAERKAIPVWSGFFRYFPSAIIEVAKVSEAGNRQHNPGQPLHWARGKSTNQHDTLGRHLLDADAVEGTLEEIEHLRSAGWRLFARLQLACERHGAPIAPGARLPEGGAK